MEKFYSIKEAAKHTSLSEHTLRYYEKIGLVTDIKRSAAGHRLYSVKDLEWVTFLRFSHKIGMSIQQMQTFAALKKAGPSAASERLTFLQNYHRNIREQIVDRELYLSLLDRKINLLQEKITTGNFDLDSATLQILFDTEAPDEKQRSGN